MDISYELSPLLSSIHPFSLRHVAEGHGVFFEDQQIFLAHRLILLPEQHLFLADQRIGLADWPGLSIVHHVVAFILMLRSS